MIKHNIRFAATAILFSCAVDSQSQAQVLNTDDAEIYQLQDLSEFQRLQEIEEFQQFQEFQEFQEFQQLQEFQDFLDRPESIETILENTPDNVLLSTSGLVEDAQVNALLDSLNIDGWGETRLDLSNMISDSDAAKTLFSQYGGVDNPIDDIPEISEEIASVLGPSNIGLISRPVELQEFLIKSGYVLPGPNFGILMKFGPDEIIETDDLWDSIDEFELGSPLLTGYEPDPDSEVTFLNELKIAGAATGLLMFDSMNNPKVSRSGDELQVRILRTYGDIFAPACMAEKKEFPLLGTCSGVLVQEGDLGEPKFLTARHCFANAVPGAGNFYVIFDYDTVNFEFNTRTLKSKSYGLVDLGSIRTHASLDIATVSFSADFGNRLPSAIQVRTDAEPAVGSVVSSFGHPLGQPKMGVFGEATLVDFVEENLFGAYVDHFNVSSGSPIFGTNDFSLLGILASHARPEDFVDSHDEQGNECKQEAIVRADAHRPVVITRLSALSELAQN